MDGGMEHITIPDIYCPFPSSLNVHVEAVHAHSMERVQRLRLIQQEQAFRRFSFARFAWAAARSYPDTEFVELAWVNDWLVWLFMFDDQFDDGALGADPEAMKLIMSELLNLLSAQPDPRGSCSPIAAALLDFWQRAPGATPVWRARFQRHLADYFASYLWEAANRVSGRIPEVDAYIANRQHSGGLPTCFDLIELSEHVVLPPSYATSQTYQALSLIANNVVCWVNDLFSFRKERARGEVNNLVLVVQHDRGCTLQEAAAVVNEMVTREVQYFLAIEQQLSLHRPETYEALKKYLRVFRGWMRGNLDWSLETPRYADVEETVPGQAVSYLEPLLLSSSPDPGE
jgi:Terpene synthase family 2, C-terminal metal binding